jgi:hypothetical protein
MIKLLGSKVFAALIQRSDRPLPSTGRSYKHEGHGGQRDVDHHHPDEPVKLALHVVESIHGQSPMFKFSVGPIYIFNKST